MVLACRVLLDDDADCEEEEEEVKDCEECPYPSLRLPVAVCLGALETLVLIAALRFKLLVWWLGGNGRQLNNSITI